MTPVDKNGTLNYALQLWASMMADDFGEIRSLWYPAQTPGLHVKGSVTESAWEDLECSFEQSVVQAVQGAVKSLTAAQRGALERELGLTAVCRIPHYDDRLEEARQKVWLALLANGCAS